MKRCWFGTALLILILVLGIAVTWLMDQYHTPIAQQLQQAALCAENAQWEQARQYTASARSRWEQHRKSGCRRKIPPTAHPFAPSFPRPRKPWSMPMPLSGGIFYNYEQTPGSGAESASGSLHFR